MKEPYSDLLREQGDRRDAAKREAAEALVEIERLARLAREAGQTKLSIAHAARISRVTLDELLKR